MSIGSRPTRAALQAALFGAASFGLFLAVFVFGLGVPFAVVLPALPLLIAGLKDGLIPLTYALLSASILSLPLAGPQATLFFLGFIGIPTLLLAPALAHRAPRPMGLLLTDLAVYAALAAAGIMVHLSGRGGLEHLLIEGVHQSFADADPAMRDAVETLVSRWSFLMLGASAWWWVLLFYVHTLFAAWLLRANGVPAPSREALALTPFDLPAWMLGALIAAALASFAADPEIAFSAKALFIIFLLPYFLLGAGLVHIRARAWPHRGLLLFLLYFFTLSQAWPALILACIGVVWQVKAMTHRISA